MATSADELQALKDEAANLRTEVKTIDQGRIQSEQESANDVAAAQLKKEIEELKVRKERLLAFADQSNSGVPASVTTSNEVGTGVNQEVADEDLDPEAYTNQYVSADENEE